jgi:hypothetical protein
MSSLFEDDNLVEDSAVRKPKPSTRRGLPKALRERIAEIETAALKERFRKFQENTSVGFCLKSDRELHVTLDPVERVVIAESEDQCSDTELEMCAREYLECLYENACDKPGFPDLRAALTLIHVEEFEQARLPSFKLKLQKAAHGGGANRWKLAIRTVGRQ